MIVEKGIVESSHQGIARVRIIRTSACNECGVKGACHVFGGKEILIEVANTLGAKSGERIELALEGSLVKISFLLYLLPTIGFILGAYLGVHWASSLGVNPVGPSAGLGFLLLGAAFLLIRRISKKSETRRSLAPRMLRILPPSEPLSD